MSDYAKGGYIDPEWVRDVERYLSLYDGCAIKNLVAQHTYTPACDGFHDPGPCPTVNDGRQ